MNGLRTGFALLTAVFAFLFPGGQRLSARTGADSLAVIHGTVQSNDVPHWPLSPVLVQVTENGKDTQTLYTRSSGKFHIRNIRPGEIRIKLRMPGYVPREDNMTVIPGINIVLFRLDHLSDTIQAATVVSERQLIRKVGDTTVVAARHIETMTGDRAIEMLRQVPGIEIGSDGITYQGQPIKRTYVNGMLIYGDKVDAALKSLYADDVDEVRIYDELSPQDRRRGIRKGNKETVMNLVSSRTFLKATDMSLSLSAGTQCRYSALHEAKFFSERLLLEESLLADNMAPEMANVTAVDPLQRGVLQGDVRSLSGRVGADRYWKDRHYGNSLHASIQYKRDGESRLDASDTHYLDESLWGKLHYRDTSSVFSGSGTISASLLLDMKDTKIKSWSLSQTMRISSSEDRFLRSTLKTDDESLLNRSVSSNETDRRSWDYGGKLSWADNDLGVIRPSFDVQVNAARGHGSGQLLDTLSTSILQRLLHLSDMQNKLSINCLASLDWILLNRESSSLSMNVNYGFSSEKMLFVKDAWDYFCHEDAPVRDPVNTYDQSDCGLTHQIGLTMNYLRDQCSVKAGVVGRRVTIGEEVRFPGPVQHEDWHFLSLCPSVNLGIGRNFRMDFTTSAVHPTAEMLRDRTDNSHPYFTIKGNPLLRQEYSTALKASYDKALNRRNASLSLTVEGLLTDNSLTSRTFLEDGVVVSTYGNASGRKALRASSSYTKNIPGKKLYLRGDLSAAASVRPQFNFDQQIALVQNSVTLDGTAQWRFRKKLFLFLSASVSALAESGGAFHANSIMERLLVQPSYTFGAGRFFLAGRYVLANQHFVSGYGMDRTTHDLGLKAGWWIRKGKTNISISGHDLLCSASPYVHTMTAAYEQTSTSMLMGRYLMLNFRYVFHRKQ